MRRANGWRLALGIAGALFMACSAVASPGETDTNFNVTLNASVRTIALQGDGKILVGGGFTNVNGQARMCIARLNEDGSLDASFNAGNLVGYTQSPFPTLAAPFVSSIVLQPDGKILVCGDFQKVAGVERPSIARLHSNGSLDTNFLPVVALGVGSQKFLMFNLALQNDSKILVLGRFSSINGTNRDGFARLNTDGSLDSTVFQIQFGRVASVITQPDGSTFVGGSFSYIPTNHYNVARLTADGSLDTNYAVLGVSQNVSALAQQADGKLVIGGGANDSFGGQPYNGIARLDANGNLDGSFNVGAGPNGVIEAVALQADGKAIVIGSFTAINGISRQRIARLNTNGSVDASFTGSGLGGSCSPFCPQVEALALQPDGKILVGGEFTTVNGVGRTYLARLKGDDLLRFTGIRMLPAGAELSGSTATNGQVRLDFTTNLSDWVSLTELSATNKTFHYVDGEATNSATRYYRVMQLP